MKGEKHMLIRSLRLTNVRCFDDFEMSFVDESGSARKLTLLQGKNNSGKTTILQAIALLATGSEGFLDLVCDADDWIRIGKDQCRIEVEIIRPDGCYVASPLT